MTFLFNTLAFRDEFDYRNFDSKMFTDNIFSTHCTNLIKIGPVTPVTRLRGQNLHLFGQDGQNRHFVPNITAYTRLILTTNSLLVDRCMLIIKLK